MCLSPIMIPNINRVTPYKGDTLVRFKDCESFEIPVPCGVCSECLQMKQFDLVQRVQQSYFRNHMFFGTLTYSDDALLSVIDSAGNEHKYANYKDFYLMMKRFRQYKVVGERDVKYLCATEYGSNTHRPHFHFILFVEKYEYDDEIYIINLQQELYDWFKSNWRRNYGTKLKPVWKPLFKYKCIGRYRNYDFHYCSSHSGDLDNVSFYVTKYVLKYDSWFDKKNKFLYATLPFDEYFKLKSLISPKVRFSKGFGLTPDTERDIDSGIRRGIASTDYPFPIYYNRVTGSSEPLGRYYRKKFYTKKHAEMLFGKNHLGPLTDSLDKASYEVFNKSVDRQSKFQKNMKRLDDRNLDL